MAKGTKYEVHSECGAAVFTNVDDAVNAIWLLGFYHGFEVNKNIAKKALENRGFYDIFPLSVTKSVYLIKAGGGRRCKI